MKLKVVLTADEPDATRLYLFLSTLFKKANIIMASQEQLAADLKAISMSVEKIGAETTATLAKVADLEVALARGGMTSPEVDAAIDALKVQVQRVDDLVQDAPAPPLENSPPPLQEPPPPAPGG